MESSVWVAFLHLQSAHKETVYLNTMGEIFSMCIILPLMCQYLWQMLSLAAVWIIVTHFLGAYRKYITKPKRVLCSLGNSGESGVILPLMCQYLWQMVSLATIWIIVTDFLRAYLSSICVSYSVYKIVQLA